MQKVGENLKEAIILKAQVLLINTFKSKFKCLLVNKLDKVFKKINFLTHCIKIIYFSYFKYDFYVFILNFKAFSSDI